MMLSTNQKATRWHQIYITTLKEIYTLFTKYRHDNCTPVTQSTNHLLRHDEVGISYIPLPNQGSDLIEA